jgi:hypothetical protein
MFKLQFVFFDNNWYMYFINNIPCMHVLQSFQLCCTNAEPKIIIFWSPSIHVQLVYFWEPWKLFCQPFTGRAISIRHFDWSQYQRTNSTVKRDRSFIWSIVIYIFFSNARFWQNVWVWEFQTEDLVSPFRGIIYF